MEKKIFFDKIVICFIIIIAVGLFQAYEFQQNSIQPLELAINHLDRIIITVDSSAILSDIFFVKENIPHSGNPVFIYPTYNTDFEKMQMDLDIIITSVEKISSVPTDSSSYHTGMEAVNAKAVVLKENIMDTKPYLYASLPNVFFTAIWLVGTIGLVETLIRKTESLY